MTRTILSRHPGAVFLFVLAALVTGAADAAAKGISWAEMTFLEALEQAGREDKLLMVDVHAGHCMQCKEMDEVLWETPAGAALGEGLIAVKVASDRPEANELRRRYPILGLPVVIFIKPGGEELGRVVGFRSVKSFLAEVDGLREWIDPLPPLEAELEANPNSITHLLTVLEQYIYRMREADARELLDRIMVLDPEHRSREATKALTLTAKYQEQFRRDWDEALALWKSLVQLYPTLPSVSSGIKGSCTIAKAWDQEQSWIDWICDIGAQYPESGRLHYNIAMISYREGLTDACLAKSARIAIARGVGPKNMDEIAAALGGSAASDE